MDTKNSHGTVTLALANICHSCGICARAEQKPTSTFARIMRWHRRWCPAWAAHSKVYGPKVFSRSDQEEEGRHADV